MAVTGVAVTLTNSTITAGAPAYGVVAVTTGTGNAVNLTGIFVTITGGGQQAFPPVVVDLSMGSGAGGVGRINKKFTVNISSTYNFPFSFTAHQPQIPGASNQTYALTATVYDATPAVTSSSPTNVTVRPPSTVAM